MWPFRTAASKLRPFNAATVTRTTIVLALFAAFLYGDFALFRRLFAALAKVEASTPFFARSFALVRRVFAAVAQRQASPPFFALGLLRNLLALVFLAAIVMLFSS